MSQELDAGLETCTRWNGLLPFVSDVMLLGPELCLHAVRTVVRG